MSKVVVLYNGGSETFTLREISTGQYCTQRLFSSCDRKVPCTKHQVFPLMVGCNKNVAYLSQDTKNH